MSNLTRLRNFFFRKEESSAVVESDVTALHIYKSSKCKNRAILVTIIQVDEKNIQNIIDITVNKMSKDHTIVYVTDNSDFSILRKNNVIFEYVPSRLQQNIHKDRLSWKPYLAERWELILVKWRPLKILSYGQPIDSFLATAPEQEASSE
ncbi:hypothetical protein [Roseibium aggregatum]|uniref:Uncharacterized protein n=1 Tax=Roseibium aggregatum TaxID=187304 RepID=A0A0M6YBW5_9HYPH|nr:hypothetical protein [Roseibium aggregatum]CTQ47585.1 hypothetical protein LAL4801_06047 [Roseibium aggregatum]